MQQPLLLPLLLGAATIIVSSAGATSRQLQPLIEASGAAHGDLVAGGTFCPRSGPVRPVLAVVEAASLSVSLLAGPTPHLVRRLTPVASSGSSILGGGGGGFLSTCAAFDVDADGQDELAIGWSDGQVVVLRFSGDCSSVTVAARTLSVCYTLPCDLVALVPVPTTVAPAGLVAVRSREPFVLLGVDTNNHLTVHGVSTFNITASTDSWVAAAASANRSQILLLRASSAVSLMIDASGKVSVAAQRNASTIVSLSNGAEWRSAAVVDFAGDGRTVAVLVDNTKWPHATMLAMPSLRVLGGGRDPRQQMDSNYSWSSIAVASLSDAYGAAATAASSSQPSTAMNPNVPRMQQLRSVYGSSRNYSAAPRTVVASTGITPVASFAAGPTLTPAAQEVIGTSAETSHDHPTRLAASAQARDKAAVMLM